MVKKEPRYIGMILLEGGIEPLYRDENTGKLYLMDKPCSKYPFRPLKNKEKEEFRKLFGDLFET